MRSARRSLDGWRGAALPATRSLPYCRGIPTKGGEMANLQLRQPPIAKAEMLIRRPVAEVFQAFVDPAITTKFWFTRSSGPLEAAGRVQWEWEMYDLSL